MMSDSNFAATQSTRVPACFEFRAPWYVDSDSRLREELVRECSSGHSLFGIVARTVARRRDCDDVLFELFGPVAPGEFAVVHLAWAGRERTARIPWTIVFATFQHWVVECMEPQASEWGAIERDCEKYTNSQNV